MSEQFKEEYWADAIQVLKREERKAWWRAYGLWLLLGLVTASAALLMLWPQGETAMAHDEYRRSIDIDSKAVIAQTDALAHTNLNNEEVQSSERPTASSATSLEDVSQNQATNLDTANDADGRDGVSDHNETVRPDAVQLAANESSNDEGNTGSFELVDDYNEIDTKESASAVVEGTPTTDERQSEPSLSQVTSSPATDMSNLAKAEITEATNKISLVPLTRRMTVASVIRPQLVRDYREYNSKTLFEYKDDRLFAFAGNSFLTGYGSYKRDLFFNPEVGIGYEDVFAEHWSANVSLSYFMINGVRHSADFTSTQLDFGYNSTVTTVSTLKLHYGYLPIKINYDLNRRTSFSLGAGVSYLINSRSLVTVKEVDNFEESEVDRREEWGYVGGYRTISGSLLAGYEFRLTEDLTFGLDYQYGLQKITLENIYGQVSEDRNSRLRVLIKYNIK